MIVSVKGAELFCSERGEGPVCLVLCNLGTGPFERMTPAPWGERFRLVFVDVRGSGRSTGSPGDLTFDVLSEDLEAVRRQLGVPKVAVFGYSIVSVLAIEHGRRCPEGVSHVITAGAPPGGDMMSLMKKAEAFFEEDGSDERKRILQENMARLPAGTPPAMAVFAQTPKRFFDPRFDAASLFADAILKPEFMARLLGSLTAGWDVTAGPSPLRVPLFLGHGRYDYTVPHVLWKDVLPKLPTATFRLFERSGHQPFFEEADAFSGAVLEWMRGQAQSAS